jgi:hypothetical protein
MSAQIEYGFYQFSGTPKTIDNTLNALFKDSTMAEWIIKCGAVNITSLTSRMIYSK